jgi:CheY-like chemotaxis protein
MAAKILIVDDDLEAVKLIGLMLERQGYEIAAAQLGAQALAKARTENPALVILDIMMPDMDGFEVCRRLRADPATASLPIIMFTAKATTSDKVAGFQAGADDYLTKPVHPEELLSRIEAVLLRSVSKQAEGQPQTRTKVVGFLGSKGGVGTTTLAVNAAVTLALGPAKGRKIVLADVRSGMATAAVQLGLRRQGGIARLLDQPAESIDTRAVEVQLEEHKSGIFVLGGQIEPPGIAAVLPPAHVEAIVEQLGTLADYLLLDMGAGLDEVNRRLLPGCQSTVVTIEPQRVSLTLAQVLLSTMTDSLSLARHKIRLVLINRSPSAATYSKDMLEGLLQHELVGVVPPAPELAFQAAEQGVPMVMIQPASLVAQQIKVIAEHLASA